MHLRKLVLACGFASFALSNYASALGLGEVKLKSTLNQPLNAEVQLLDTRDLSAEQIIVALASPADFERNGVDRLYFYTEFQFEVDLNHTGGPVVRITTRNPVREPYLNFLVEARWTSGRLLREYTVLMDLPTFDDAAPKAVQAPEAKPKAAKPRVDTAPVTSPSTANSSASSAQASEEKPAIIAEQDESAKKSKVGSGTYGPIGAKDTLWDIALAVRPDSSVSVHQTMLALQRLNPDAFIHGNINLIKKGQVLRVPDTAEISSVSKSEAVSQVNSQINNWSGATPSTGLGAQLDASKHTVSARRDSEPVAGRVKLEAPSSANKSGNGQGSGANKGSGRALESELAATLEELDKAKSEKTELSSRVHDLEEQVKTMQRLVDVSNEKLRAMQLNAQAANTTSAESKVSSSSAKVTAVSQASSEAASPAAVVAAGSSADSQSVSSAPAAPKKEIKKPVKPIPAPVVEKSLVDQAFDNIAYVGAGALALVLLGGALIMRRRKAQAEEEAARSSSESTFESEPDFSAFAQAPEDSIPEEAPVDEMSLFDDDESSAVAETGDVVGEADIYIAYGKYDQAEEMLLNGLAKDPANTDIRLKLLEVYSHTQNLAEFDKHYSVILPLATGFALSRAAELRSNISGADASDSPDLQDDARHLENIDEEALTLAAQTDSHLPEDDFSFDLDLDDTETEIKTSSTSYDMDLSDKPSSSLADLDDDFSLDFDTPADTPKSQAEDLSDISFALDSLDDDGLPDDVEVASSEGDDEFNFDFKDLDAGETTLAQDVEAIKAPNLADEETLGDDFNFDVDVNDLDLAALDHEMESLDALDDQETTAPAGDTVKAAEVADFDELELAEEETSFAIDSNADLASLEVDGDDFDWDDEELPAAPDAESPESVAFGADLDDDLVIDDESESEVDAFGEEEATTAESLGFEETTLNLADDDSDLNFDADLEAPVDDELQALDDIPDSVAAPSPVAEAEIAEDDLFEQALSDFSADNFVMDETSDMSDDGLDDDLDFMSDVDEAATKLDLARAYMDMGDNEGARDILAEVSSEGNEEQRREAAELLGRIEA